MHWVELAECTFTIIWFYVKPSLKGGKRERPLQVVCCVSGATDCRMVGTAEQGGSRPGRYGHQWRDETGEMRAVPSGSGFNSVIALNNKCRNPKVTVPHGEGPLSPCGGQHPQGAPS